MNTAMMEHPALEGLTWHNRGVVVAEAESEVERAGQEWTTPFLGKSGLLATCSEDKMRDDVLLVNEDMLQSWTKPMEPFEPSLQLKRERR